MQSAVDLPGQLSRLFFSRTREEKALFALEKLNRLQRQCREDPAHCATVLSLLTSSAVATFVDEARKTPIGQ
jgi:hypothetical protein